MRHSTVAQCIHLARVGHEQGLESVRAFNAEGRIIKQFEEANNRNSTAFFLFWVRVV